MMSKKHPHFKRTLAFLLSVVMLLMQLPMGVFAVEASGEEEATPTGVLAIGSSVTVEEETLYTFTPGQSGVYCFYSSCSKGSDPKMRLLDADKQQLAQDDDSGEELNFELHYELSEGTTYYVEAGAYDGRFPYTLTVKESDLSSIEIVSIPTFEVEEYDMRDGGGWVSVYQNEIVDRYFRYYPYEAMRQAVIKVHYKDGTSEEVAYLDENEERTGISMDWDFYQNPWTVGSDNHYYITYKGLKALANATVIESSVTAIEVTSIDLPEFVERDESQGYWVSYYQGLELEEPYFSYSIEEAAWTIELSVTYADGSTEQVPYCDDNGDYTGICIYSDQYQQPWTVGENEFEIWYRGAYVTATATLVESPVQSIRVIEGGSFEYTEFDESYGYWMGEEAFYYYPNRFMQDIVLEVTYKDGSTEEIAAIEDDAVTYRSSQDETPWTVGGDNELHIAYKGVSTIAHVTVKPGIVESISVEDVVITEGTNGSFYEHDTEDGKDIWFRYDIFADNITVKLTDGTTVSGNQEYIREQLGVSVMLNPELYQYYEEQWGVGEYKITASLMGKKAEFLFIIQESDIASISVEDIELEQNQGGYWESGYWDNYGNWVEGEWFRYQPRQQAQMTVTFKDSTVFTGTMDEFENEYHMWPQVVTDQSYYNQWQVGETYIAKVYLGGKRAEFSVTVVESNITGIEVIDTQGYKYFEHDTSIGEWRGDYFYYSPWYLASRVTIRVTYKDGTTADIPYYDEYGNYNDISFSEKQDETPWTVGGENLLTILYGGARTTVSAVIEQSPIESIVVDDITHTQHTGGHWDNGGYWDENDNWVDADDYYCYSIVPQNITITYTDGRVVSGTPYEIEQQTGIYPEFGSEQNWQNQWGIGEHTATLIFMGKTVEYTVSVVESDIASITASSLTYVEGTGGWWQQYHNEGEEAGYYYYYDIEPERITVTYKDGNSITGTYDEIEQQTGYRPDTIVDQAYNNQWGVGTHTVTVSLMGAMGEFDVAITPSPVASIEVESVTYTEHTYGDWRYHYHYTEDGEQQYYHYHVYPDKVTVTYTDNTVISGTPYEIEQQTGYVVSAFDTQDYYNQWGIGTYTATAAFMGKTADFTVEIEASPIESITVDTVYLEEGTNGYWHYSNPDGYYFGYNPCPQNMTITYTDGTELTGSYDELNEQLDGELSYGTMQEGASWGVGTHTATVTYMDVTVEYDVVITETQIESVTVMPIIAVAGKDGWTNSEYYDQTDGTWYPGEWYEYNTYPEMMMVTFKDGSTFTGNRDDFSELGYAMRLEHDQGYHNEWGTGVHPVTLIGVGFEASYVVEIVDEIESEEFSYGVLSDGTAVVVGYNGSAADVVIPDSIDGYEVSVIAANLFQSSGVQSLTVPATVKRIESSAFYWNQSLETVRLYAGVEVIGKNAFEDCCNLRDVIFYGTAQQAEDIVLFAGNEYLKNAQWRYAAECTEHEYDDACDAECNICYAVREPEHAFEWVIDYAGNCVEDGRKHEECTLCDAVRNLDTVIPAKGEHTNTELLNEEEATCGKWGYSGDVYCHDCDAYIQIGESIEPTEQHEHTDIINGYDATCGAEGYTGDLYCYDCGNTLVPGESIPATGNHGALTVINASDATCNEAGYTGDVFCKDCQTTVQYGQEIPATDKHVYDNGYDADCNECGAVREVTLKPAALSLGGGTAYQGETIRVDVSIDGNTGFAGLQFGVLYDNTYLTLKDVETQMEDFYVTVGNSIVFDAIKNHTADGVIATLVFEVAEDAPIGEYNVQLRFMSGSTEDFEAVVMTDSATTIKVESAVAGDANGDGKVDTTDLVMLRRYLASMDPVTMTGEIAVKKGADANSDGVIDAIDLAFVRQYLASMSAG